MLSEVKTEKIMSENGFVWQQDDWQLSCRKTYSSLSYYYVVIYGLRV